MGSVYARGESLWIKFKGPTGQVVRRPSGYRRGQEADVRAVLAEVERRVEIEREAEAGELNWPEAGATASVTPAGEQSEQTRETPSAVTVASPTTIGEPAPEGTLTVRAYGEEWLARRREHVATVDDEESRLTLHVYPLIGHMALADVRPRHVRDLVLALKLKTSDARKCRGARLAPRTVRHVYALVRRLFKSAVIDEHLAASPVVVEKGILPKNVDKDPAWRSTAIYERHELVTLISDPRIAWERRVLNALEGLAGLRHGEAAALRWSAYEPSCQPLGKIVVSRSNEKDGTKTLVTREVPAHPALAEILRAWKESGWRVTYRRKPGADDLIVPTRNMTVRAAPHSLKYLRKDLATVGLRPRRGHDLRRTFVTLLQIDGARREVIKTISHGVSEADILDMYTSFPWPTLCEEIAKLRVSLPATPPPGRTNDGVAAKTNGSSPISSVPSLLGHTPGHTPECAQEKSCDSEPMPGFEPGTYGLRNRCSTTELHRRGGAGGRGLCRTEGRWSRAGRRGPK